MPDSTTPAAGAGAGGSALLVEVSEAATQRQTAETESGERPAPLATLSFTTRSKVAAAAIAELYGGQVREQNGDFEVITDRTEIAVQVPPRDTATTQADVNVRISELPDLVFRTDTGSRDAAAGTGDAAQLTEVPHEQRVVAARMEGNTLEILTGRRPIVRSQR